MKNDGRGIEDVFSLGRCLYAGWPLPFWHPRNCGNPGQKTYSTHYRWNITSNVLNKWNTQHIWDIKIIINIGLSLLSLLLVYYHYNIYLYIHTCDQPFATLGCASHEQFGEEIRPGFLSNTKHQQRCEYLKTHRMVAPSYKLVYTPQENYNYIYHKPWNSATYIST